MGTTLEILAPYLPYGIEVEVSGVISTSRASLIGLIAGEGRSEQDVDGARVRNTDRVYPAAYYSTLDLITPVLYSFADLTKQLPDGTVAAVEVAKLALGSPHFVDHCTPNARMEGDSLIVSFGAMETPFLIVGQDTYAMAWVDSDKDVNPIVDQIGAIDYLRSLHFALPVNGKPLVEGVDYIRKEL